MSGLSNADPIPTASRFEGSGVNFRAKLIGSEIVAEARGDKMCQESIQRLKAIVKISKEHKQRIIVNVSLEGLKIMDQATANIDHTHEVHRISFISRDITDSRAFGYIYGPGDGSHKFFAIKTEKAAEQLVLSLRDLFQVVYDLKKKEVEEAKKQKECTTITLKDAEVGESDDSVYQVPQNGAPVEGSEDVYAVPKSNQPVEEKSSSGGNLLDLEDQLTSIEKGIEQMSNFDTLFDAIDTPTAPANTSSSASLDLAWATTTTSAPAAQQAFGMPPNLGGTAPGTPFPGFTSTAQSPFQPGFQQPVFSASGGFGVPPPPPRSAPAPPFGAAPTPPFGTAAASPFGAAPAAPFGTSTASPFGTTPAFGLQPPPSQRAPFQQPAGQFQPPAAADPFASDPFGSTATPATSTGMFGAPSSNPFGAAPGTGGSLFPPSTVSNGNSGWPNSSVAILAPMKPAEDDTAATETKAEPKKDHFSDLCDIGSLKVEKQSPKEMFDKKNAAPRKTLNELKAETLTVASNPPLPPSPQPQPTFGSGDPFGMLSPSAAAPAAPSNDPFGNIPSIPTTQQASEFTEKDPFGSLNKEVNQIPDMVTKAADPFDTSTFLHLSNPANSTSSSKKSYTPLDHSLQRPRPKAKKPENILNGNLTQKDKTSVWSDNEFNLPSPDEPPPPLPSDALKLSNNAPKPPPRPPSVTSKSSTSSRSNSFNLNSLSMQSNLSGSSAGSDDPDNLSSLSPASPASSSDRSPVPRVAPRRTNSSASSSDTPATPNSFHKHPASSVLNISASDNKSQTNTTPFQRYPVPKPRKSLSKRPSLNSADPFIPTTTPDNNIFKDCNDNDPFLSSQPKTSGDFDSKWDVFNSDSKWDAFTSDSKWNSFKSESKINSKEDAFNSDVIKSDSKRKPIISDFQSDPFAIEITSDPFANDPFASDTNSSNSSQRGTPNLNDKMSVSICDDANLQGMVNNTIPPFGDPF